MSGQLAYALITPYSLLKSRTGGIIGRLLAHTRLRIGFNQTGDDIWSAKLVYKKTNAQGECLLSLSKIKPGYLTIMITVDTCEQGLVEPGVEIVKVE